VPLYSFLISFGIGAALARAAQFDLADDEDAVALSIPVLRDQNNPDAQVWVMQGDRPVGVRVRDAWDERGVLLRLRIPQRSKF
jgi:hypothetical protein